LYCIFIVVKSNVVWKIPPSLSSHHRCLPLRTSLPSARHHSFFECLRIGEGRESEFSVTSQQTQQAKLSSYLVRPCVVTPLSSAFWRRPPPLSGSSILLTVIVAIDNYQDGHSSHYRTLLQGHAPVCFSLVNTS
jgi:hypothetical protein